MAANTPTIRLDFFLRGMLRCCRLPSSTSTQIVRADIVCGNWRTEIIKNMIARLYSPGVVSASVSDKNSGSPLLLDLDCLELWRAPVRITPMDLLLFQKRCNPQRVTATMFAIL